MLFQKPFLLRLMLAASLLASLSACAGNGASNPFAPDPQLPAESGSQPPANSPDGEDSPAAMLQDSFPGEIPQYRPAQVQEVIEPRGDTTATQVRWTSPDPTNAIAQYYTSQFQDNNWQLISENNRDGQTILEARQDNLQASVSIQPGSQAATEFTIEYQTGNETIASPEPAASPTENSTSKMRSQTFSDLDKAPEELRPYVRDLAKVGVFSSSPDGAKNEDAVSDSQFKPNQPITRREYARWLMVANNTIYTNRPSKQIRVGLESEDPTFEDVPASDPDFPEIQGLANAGIIPSPLTGDSTNVSFQPDNPLTREDLLVWKVPLDLRRNLPNASIDAVKETWGFQDTSKIDPKALRAVLADYQNGDSSNIRRAFGYTMLFQPDKSVTRAEAASTLGYFGYQGEGRSAEDALKDRS